jgi:transposase
MTGGVRAERRPIERRDVFARHSVAGAPRPEANEAIPTRSVGEKTIRARDGGRAARELHRPGGSGELFSLDRLFHRRGPRGYDAGKKINGRKRHILVDVLGLILAVVVHPADVQDRDGAKLVLEKIIGAFRRLRLIWADGGYAGRLIEWVLQLRRRGKVTLEIVKRSDDVSGFKVLPKRWIVERTFGWLGRWRRLSKDYEFLTETSETVIHVAMIGLMARRLAAK